MGLTIYQGLAAGMYMFSPPPLFSFKQAAAVLFFANGVVRGMIVRRRSIRVDAYPYKVQVGEGTM